MYELVNTEKKLTKWLSKLNEVAEFVFDTETTSVKEHEAKLVGVSVATRDGLRWKACYIPCGHVTGEKQLTVSRVVGALKPFLESKKIVKIGHNLGYDIGIMLRHGVRIENIHDTMLMSYALTGQQMRHVGHGMDALADHYLCGYTTIRFTDLVNEELGIHNFSQVRLRDACVYSAEDCDVTGRLYDVLSNKLRNEGLWELYNDVDRPCVVPIAHMKHNGLLIDRSELARFESVVKPEVEKIERWAAREGLNISSPKDVGRYLYDVLRFDDKKGNQSTAKEVLEALENKDETGSVTKILEHRKLAKLISSFVNAWPEFIDDDGIIHPNFNLCVTVTGRLSGSDPNAQQIPSRDELGKQIRNAIIAADGDLVVCADYSQIEYRILAHITRAKELLRAYRNNEDLHAAMAAQVRGGHWTDYNNKKDEKRYKIRTTFKNVNFAVIYGAGPPKIASMSKVPLEEANEILDAHAELVPEVYDWKKQVIREAAANGYSQTLFGRRVHVPGITSRDWGTKGHAERLAVNGVIQGTAADLMRLAIPRVRKWCNDDVLLRASVHDELLLTAPEDVAEDVARKVKREMECAADHEVKWRVPIIVETGVGHTWLEAK